MNDFLINQLIGNLDIEDRINFIKRCNNLLLNDEIFTKENFRVNNIDLTFSLLVSICNYYATNGSRNNQKILERLKAIKLKKIYYQAVKKLTNEEKNKNKVSIDNLFKEYYILCEKCNWNEEVMKKARKNAKNIDNDTNKKFTFNEIVIFNELRVEQIIEYGSFYAKEMLEKNRSKKVRELINSENYHLFVTLLNVTNKKTITEYLIDNYYKLDLKKIKEQIPQFVQNYAIAENITDENALANIEKELIFKIKNTLVAALSEVKGCINKEKSENESKKASNIENDSIEKQAEKIINLYLNGKYMNIKHFCKENHLGIGTFKSYLKVLEKTKTELYVKIKNKLYEQSKSKYSSINEELNKMLYYIENGVSLDDGTIKEFDIIDCCSLIKIPFISIRSLLNSSDLSIYDLKMIRDFLNVYTNSYTDNKNLSRKILFKERNIIILNGQSHEITNDEKEVVIAYLENNNIPLLNTTYNIALKRFFEGTLIQNSKQKKLS